MNPCHLLSLHVLLGCLIFHTETGKGAGFLESQLGIQEEDRVGGLINKMMLNNSVSFAGEGMVGQATFTGNYQWILMNNFSGDAYPPEVYSELHYQFSAGMQGIQKKYFIVYNPRNMISCSK